MRRLRQIHIRAPHVSATEPNDLCVYPVQTREYFTSANKLFSSRCQRINDDSLHDVWTWINTIVPRTNCATSFCILFSFSTKRTKRQKKTSNNIIGFSVIVLSKHASLFVIEIELNVSATRWAKDRQKEKASGIQRATNATTTTATQFYFNENLLPSENMSIKFWRELNEMKLGDVKNLSERVRWILKLTHHLNTRAFWNLLLYFLICLWPLIFCFFKFSYNINYVTPE